MNLRGPYADVKRVAVYLQTQGYDEYTARQIALATVRRWSKSPRTKAAAREER